MKNLWNSFEAWLSSNFAEGLEDLNPPATDDEISHLEHHLGFSLPADFVDCLKIHNGQKNTAGGLFEATEFLSTRRIAEEWKVWKELHDGGDFEGNLSNPAEGVKNDWWNPKWVPFTYNGAGDHFCLDLDPAPGGQSGQVITMWHDFGERALLAPSFQVWFQNYVQAILDGKYVYSEDYETLVPIEDV